MPPDDIAISKCDFEDPHQGSQRWKSAKIDISIDVSKIKVIEGIARGTISRNILPGGFLIYQTDTSHMCPLF